MKGAKENWIEEQCSETEENLGKNNNKRAHQVVKDLTSVKKRGKLLLSKTAQVHNVRFGEFPLL